MFTRSTVVHEVPSSKRPQRAVIVSPRRPVRQALAVALAEAGFEVVSLESARMMPWLETLRPAEEPECEYVVVNGDLGRALAAVDLLRAQGIVCPVRIVAGEGFFERDVA
jgi:hypothetical protein